MIYLILEIYCFLQSGRVFMFIRFTQRIAKIKVIAVVIIPIIKIFASAEPLYNY